MKIAVVCGGSRGLGRAVAHELARSGYAVAVCARTEPDVMRVKLELEQLGATAYAEACDLRDPRQARAFVARAEDALGPIDVLVANAATITVGPVEMLGIRAFDEAHDSIFNTALHPVLSVLPRMRARRRGTIAFITSIGGKVGVPHLAPYCAAKFATVGLAESLAAEAARDGVRVLTVVPGLMRTASFLHALFVGNSAAEYAWFAPSAMAPLASIDPERAARRIVRAIARGRRRLVYTAPARVAARLHDVVPGLFGAVTRLAGRALPKAPPAPASAEGQAFVHTVGTPLFAWLDHRTERAAAHNAER